MENLDQKTEQVSPNNNQENYKFDLQIVLRMSTKNSAPVINMETDLNAPISLVLHAISHIKDSLMEIVKNKTHEELVKMVVKDIMPKPVLPKPEEESPKVDKDVIVKEDGRLQEPEESAKQFHSKSTLK